MKAKTKSTKTKPTETKPAATTTAPPQVHAAPEPPKKAELDKPEISIRIPMNGRIFHAKGEFNLDVWKSASTEPSAAQFIIGTLLNAMRQQGYAE
jgi:hypothetical protein